MYAKDTLESKYQLTPEEKKEGLYKQKHSKAFIDCSQKIDGISATIENYNLTKK